MEKTAGDFLSRADLGEGAVFFGVEIDLERLLVGVHFFAVHKFPGSRLAKKIPCVHVAVSETWAARDG